MDPRSELVLLLEERTLSMWERRKRRLDRIPGPVIMAALKKNRRHRDESGPLILTREEYVALSLGWLPEELEQVLQLIESKGGNRADIRLTRVKIIDGASRAEK